MPVVPWSTFAVQPLGEHGFNLPAGLNGKPAGKSFWNQKGLRGLRVQVGWLTQIAVSNWEWIEIYNILQAVEGVCSL